MALVTIICAQCGKPSEKQSGGVNRSLALGAPLYCGLICAGLGRRKWKTEAQKVAEKAAYDRGYRLRDPEALKARKHAYFKSTYDPVKTAEERKKTMPRHIEYCRQPEYVAWKREYDRQYRAREFGDYAESFLLLQDIEREILGRATRYEIDLANGKLNKTNLRKRAYYKIVGRFPQGGPLGNPERDQGGHDAARSR